MLRWWLGSSIGIAPTMDPELLKASFNPKNMVIHELFLIELSKKTFRWNPMAFASLQIDRWSCPARWYPLQAAQAAMQIGQKRLQLAHSVSSSTVPKRDRSQVTQTPSTQVTPEQVKKGCSAESLAPKSLDFSDAGQD